MKIRKNDMVQVTAGNDRGKRGKVLKVFPDKKRIVVEGVNFIMRHTKPNQQNQQGGIVKREGTIHVSNVMLIDPKSGKPTRVGHAVLKTAEGNKRVRVARVSNEMIPE
ncbi:MAG: 50S ribosomal protein L24 [Calditrichaeota bacterium]|nr:50S ribosomal protein L24 [Calditrichota bacterium]MCB9368576.1 50S ribosomal protein L24 [Calditrichota bacterium]